jgi:NADPH:quinone reductase-like Zn-dependent oxidoreductase
LLNGRWLFFSLMDEHCGRRAVQVTPVTALPASRILGRLAADVVDGQLTVPVQRTYALADVPRALADFAAGTRGKLAISVP